MKGSVSPTLDRKIGNFKNRSQSPYFQAIDFFRKMWYNLLRIQENFKRFSELLEFSESFGFLDYTKNSSDLETLKECFQPKG